MLSIPQSYNDFYEQYSKRVVASGVENHTYATYTYDALWAMALALDRSEKQLNSKGLNLTHFSYSNIPINNVSVPDVLNASMADVSFSGVSVRACTCIVCTGIIMFVMYVCFVSLFVCVFCLVNSWQVHVCIRTCIAQFFLETFRFTVQSSSLKGHSLVNELRSTKGASLVHARVWTSAHALNGVFITYRSTCTCTCNCTHLHFCMLIHSSSTSTYYYIRTYCGV